MMPGNPRFRRALAKAWGIHPNPWWEIPSRVLRGMGAL